MLINAWLKTVKLQSNMTSETISLSVVSWAFEASSVFMPKPLPNFTASARRPSTIISPNAGKRGLRVTARVISGVASHIQVEETEALHVSRIALMVRGYLRSECVKELLSQAQDSSLTHSTLQLRATMSAIRHPCLIMGQCPSNFEGRNSCARESGFRRSPTRDFPGNGEAPCHRAGRRRAFQSVGERTAASRSATTCRAMTTSPPKSTFPMASGGNSFRPMSS